MARPPVKTGTVITAVELVADPASAVPMLKGAAFTDKAG